MQTQTNNSGKAAKTPATIVVPDNARKDFDRANRLMGRRVTVARKDHSLAKGMLTGLGWDGEIGDVVATIMEGDAVDKVLSRELAYILGPSVAAKRATRGGTATDGAVSPRSKPEPQIIRLAPGASLEELLNAIGTPISAHPTYAHERIKEYVPAFMEPTPEDLGEGDVFTPDVDVAVVEDLHINPEIVGWSVDDLVGDEEKDHVDEVLRESAAATEAPAEPTDDRTVRCEGGCGEVLDPSLVAVGETICDACAAERSVGITPTPTATTTATTTPAETPKKVTKAKTPAKPRASQSADDQMVRTSAAISARSYSKEAQLSRGTGKGKKATASTK